MISKILVVDDTPASREALEAMLSEKGYKLYMAENGLQALEQAQSTHPDLILLDVMMPGMDGFEVCRKIRASSELAEVPIIMLTALDDTASRLEGIEAGADDFISKPFDRQELRARIRTITRLNRYRSLLEQREALRDMSERLINAQEEERTRISRELHDELGQLLTVQLMEIRELQADLTLPPETLFKQLEKIHNRTYEVAIKVRRLAHDLRPPLLSTLKLKGAVETHCARFSNNSHLPIQVEIDSTVNNLPDMHQIILYRIVQEALNNIAKHAQANQAWLELSMEDGFVSLTVQDDGIGLSKSKSQGTGIGITGMQERAALVNGQLSVRSGKTGGTILSAVLPIKEGNIKTQKETA